MLYNTNAVDFLKHQPSPFIHLTVTSPPYNLGINYASSSDSKEYEDYLEFSREWLDLLLKATHPTGRICLNVPLDTNKGGAKPVTADMTRVALDAGWKYKTTIIWNEQNVSTRTAWGSFKSASAPNIITPVESVIVLYKDSWKRSAKGTSDITSTDFVDWSLGLWTFSGEKKKNVGGHPAAFPEELPKRCIQFFSYVEDTIFDPFSGSGTTLSVAKKLGRAYVGCELSKEYYEFALKRIG